MHIYGIYTAVTAIGLQKWFCFDAFWFSYSKYISQKVLQPVGSPEKSTKWTCHSEHL